MRKGAGSQVVFEAGSEWSVPLYTCATAIKATIKTTSFLLNGTDGLASLSVTEVRPKVYPNNESLPAWGVEEAGLTNANFNPVWGLVSPAYESYPNISVIRQELLYLPGYADEFIKIPGIKSQNLPANDFARMALSSTYDIEDDSSASGPMVDYTGYSNMAMYAKWQQLSRTPEDAAKIINLIWTDYAASAVVGTKSVLGARNDSNAQPAIIAVRPLINRIHYHWLFGIPAFIVLLLCLVIGTFAFLTFLFRRHGISKMRKHLHQTAVGRILTSFLYPEYTNLETPSREWSQSVGKNVIDLSGDNALMSLLAKNNFYKGGVVIQETQMMPKEGATTEGDHFLVPRSPSPYGSHSPQFP